jgi:hypothetical protein
MVEHLFSFSPLSSAYSRLLSFDSSSELDFFNNPERVDVVFQDSAPQGTTGILSEDSPLHLPSPFSLTPSFLAVKVESIKATPVPTLNHLQDSDLNRNWTLQCNSGFSENDISLQWKTRSQEFVRNIPHRMYSSLKYEFKLSLVSSMEMPFVLARISILEDSVQKEASEPLSGTVESAMSREKNNYRGLLKVQISPKLTHYHTKSSYCFEIRILDPQNLEKEIISMKSPSFKIYARKPQENDKKRKQEGCSVKPVKKMKEEEDAKEGLNEIVEFTQCLDQLMVLSSKLSEQDRNTAKNMVIHRFFTCEGSDDF